MYSVKEREEILTRLVNYLSSIESVKKIVLVGSLVGNESDIYSDIDLSVLVNDSDIGNVYDAFCEKLEQEKNIFRYFRQIYGENNYLAGIFLENGLEIDIGFVAEDIFLKKCNSKAVLKYKVMYSRDNSSLNITHKELKKEYQTLLKQADCELWYYFKNATYGIKRKRLFRVIKELDDIRNQILEIIALKEGVEFSHFKGIDKLSDEIKTKLKGTYFNKITEEELKISVLNLLELLCELFRNNDMSKEAEEYKELFIRLINDKEE